MTILRDFSNRLWSKTKPTAEQRRVAGQLGIELFGDDSFFVAAARILDAVADTIGDTPRNKPTEKQRQMASELGLDISTDSRRVTWAKIKEKWQLVNYKANMAALQTMRLAPGDTVIKHIVIKPSSGIDMEFETEHIVSSIRWDGLVYFKGGKGNCAWAQTLTKLDAKKTSPS